MSFLRIGDQAAGSVKSGGVTRRAAKMVVLDMDNPGDQRLYRLEGARKAQSAGDASGQQVTGRERQRQGL